MNEGPSHTRSLDRADKKSLDVEENRALRRRLRFWKSVASLIVLGIMLAAVVIWVRRDSHRNRCRAALEAYASHLARLPTPDDPVSLLVQWRFLDQAAPGFPPTHYDLLVPNWSAPPESEPVDLAVCNTLHGVLFDEGRNVLSRQGGTWRVRWLSGTQAERIAEEAQQYERSIRFAPSP